MSSRFFSKNSIVKYPKKNEATSKEGGQALSFVAPNLKGNLLSSGYFLISFDLFLLKTHRKDTKFISKYKRFAKNILTRILTINTHRFLRAVIFHRIFPFCSFSVSNEPSCTTCQRPEQFPEQFHRIRLFAERWMGE